MLLAMANDQGHVSMPRIPTATPGRHDGAMIHVLVPRVFPAIYTWQNLHTPTYAIEIIFHITYVHAASNVQ